MKISCLLIVFLCQSAVAAIPTPLPSPSVPASVSPAATITQSVTQLSAQRAATERSNIYRAGAAYGHWLDQMAKSSGNTFLQRAIFDRVTWVRLLSCVVALALLSLLTGWFVWIVRQHAGEIESTRYQSWLALSAAAIRKPVALFIWMCGGTFALLPIAAGIVSRPTRIFWPVRSQRFSTPDGLSRCYGWFFARFAQSKNECVCGRSERGAYQAKSSFQSLDSHCGSRCRCLESFCYCRCSSFLKIGRG